MLLQKLQASPSKIVPLAMALLVAGMAVLVIPTLLPHIPFVARLGANWNDFLRGFSYGLAITLEIGAVTILSLSLKPKSVKA